VRAAREPGSRRSLQHVAAAAHGLDQLGVAAVILQLAAQAADGDVDGAVERPGLAAAQQVQQHVAGQHPVGALHQGDQQVVFAPRERHFDGVRVEQAAARGLQRPAAEAQAAGAGLGGAGRAFAGAAQHGADAGQQFARVERFRHVVVGAEFQADDAVGFLPHRGQHDDGDVGLGAHPAREVEAGFAGQHQVQHDDVVVAGGPDAAGFPRVAGDGDAHPVLFQEAGQQVADLAVVVDDHDVR
jgi:hypothetical protein